MLTTLRHKHESHKEIIASAHISGSPFAQAKSRTVRWASLSQPLFNPIRMNKLIFAFKNCILFQLSYLLLFICPKQFRIITY